MNRRYDSINNTSYTYTRRARSNSILTVGKSAKEINYPGFFGMFMMNRRKYESENKREEFGSRRKGGYSGSTEKLPKMGSGFGLGFRVTFF